MDLEVFPCQRMTINGTIQEAIAQAVSTNTEYKIANETTAPGDVGRLQKCKYTNWRGLPDCINKEHPEWGWANWEWIHNGAEYLSRIDDDTRPSMGPDFGNCERDANSGI